jgi:four helix bundle protein
MAKLSAYKSFEIYELARKLVISCYELTHELPAEEKTNFSRYIRTAALSVHINIAQGAFAKSKKRKKYVREAKAALVIIDAALEMVVEVGFTTPSKTQPLIKLSAAIYELLDQL